MQTIMLNFFGWPVWIVTAHIPHPNPMRFVGPLWRWGKKIKVQQPDRLAQRLQQACCMKAIHVQLMQLAVGQGRLLLLLLLCAGRSSTSCPSV